MGGLLRTALLIVVVVKVLALNMFYHVRLEATHLSDTMRSDITATLLSEVCHGVAVEPHLQQLSGEEMEHRTANCEDHARLDVAVYGFWGGRFEKAFFDVRVIPAPVQISRAPCNLSREDMSKRRSDNMTRE